MKFALAIAALVLVGLCLLFSSFNQCGSIQNDQLQYSIAHLRAAQIAVEGYRSMHGGVYPIRLDSSIVRSQFERYNGPMPKYELFVDPKNGEILNPATRAGDWVISQNVGGENDAIHFATQIAKPGQVVYCPLIREGKSVDYYLLLKLPIGKLASVEINGAPKVFSHTRPVSFSK